MPWYFVFVVTTRDQAYNDKTNPILLFDNLYNKEMSTVQYHNNQIRWLKQDIQKQDK